MKHIYFDYAATTPVDPKVVEAMAPYWHEMFGNASSPHTIGQRAGKALEDARDTVADIIGSRPKDVIFNSGTTEGNNHVFQIIAGQNRTNGGHVLISAVEHHSVWEPAQHLKESGFNIEILPVDASGRVDPGEVSRRINDKTVLVAVLHASNEIGTIQPVADIGTITRGRNVPFLVDAAQTVGHIPVNVGDLKCDYLTFSAHKFYGPKGVGALYIREGAPAGRLLFGGDQERGIRASTQNIPAIVGMAAALELCREKMGEESRVLRALRDDMFDSILKNLDGVKINGDRTNRLDHHAHFSFEGVRGESLLVRLDMNGFACSMGSACASGSVAPSHALKAIGLSDALALGSLRVTLGRWTSKKDVDAFIDCLIKSVTELRSACSKEL